MLVGAAVDAANSPLGDVRWIDLTHDFSFETIFWPTDTQGFVLEENFKGMTDKGYFYSSNNYRAAEHGGTHIDAPIHFAKDGQTLDEIPLERLTGPAAVIDVRQQANANRDYQVTVQDLTNWEEQNGPLTPGVILLLRTGFDQYWPSAEQYLGTADRGPDAIPKLHFQGLHPSAAKWLVENRRIDAIGIDTASIDFGQSELYESHQILFKHEIPAFENVAHLGELPATGAYVIALPMKIKGGSGGPLRIVAALPDVIPTSVPFVAPKGEYVSQQDLYHTFRIPGMVVTRDGSILLFAEARRGDGSDPPSGRECSGRLSDAPQHRQRRYVGTDGRHRLRVSPQRRPSRFR
jgi:kynurenine formamidase